MDAVGDAEAQGQGLKLGAPVCAVRAGHDEMQIFGSCAGECFDEEVAAFLGVNAAEVEEVAPIAEGRKGAEEGFAHGGWVAVGWAHGAVGNDDAAEVTEGKALCGDALFFFAGEANGLGEIEIFVLDQRPICELFEVLEGVAAVEVGVEHAVGKDDIGDAPGHRHSCGKAVVLPDSVDDDAIETLPVFLEPLEEPGLIAVSAPARPEGMDLRAGNIGEALRGRVQRGDLDLIACALMSGGKHVRRLGGAAVAGVQRTDDMQDAHRPYDSMDDSGECAVLRGAAGVWYSANWSYSYGGCFSGP